MLFHLNIELRSLFARPSYSQLRSQHNQARHSLPNLLDHSSRSSSLSLQQWIHLHQPSNIQPDLKLNDCATGCKRVMYNNLCDLKNSFYEQLFAEPSNGNCKQTNLTRFPQNCRRFRTDPEKVHPANRITFCSALFSRRRLWNCTWNTIAKKVNKSLNA